MALFAFLDLTVDIFDSMSSAIQVQMTMRCVFS